MSLAVLQMSPLFNLNAIKWYYCLFIICIIIIFIIDIVVTVKTIELVDHYHQHVKLNLEIIDIPGNEISDVTHYSKAMVLHIFYKLNCIPSLLYTGYYISV